MRKKIIARLLALACFAPGLANAQAAPEGYQLEQVLVMSRHNLRAPLANNGGILEQSTDQSWPEWDVPGGQLTAKGGALEVNMGRYMREWLADQGLVASGECPAPQSVYVYANSLQRTVATAQSSVAGAFPGCDVPVHHQDKIGTMDPVFNPAITNNSPEFQDKAVRAMEKRREEFKLTDGYKLLEKIVGYSDSPVCKEKQQCDLTAQKDTFSAKVAEEPGVNGPLGVASALVDAFTLQYYEGFPLDQVAWGQIKTDEDWRVLSQLKNDHMDTLFASPEVAQNVAAPLVKYIQQALVGEDAANGPKMTLMVGHDSNIASLLTFLQFKQYQLPEQYEHTPIGGRIMFQRWHDKGNNQDLMKVEYVYQSTEQLRNNDVLTLERPPKRVILQLEGCPTDVNGFCSWDKFTEVLNQAVE
jgi:glucose-1-phosphatase